jgi:uncharacterized protein YjdB
VNRQTKRNIVLASTVLLAACGRRPESIDMQPHTLELGRKGETKAIQATVKDMNGRPIEGVQLEWSSNNTKSATVDTTGKVKALSTGTAQVTAKTGDVSNQVVVSVVIPATVNIDPPKMLLRGAGQSQELNVSVLDDNGQLVPGAKLTWASDNPAVATVADSKVTGVADGVAKITATAADVSGSAEVLVKGPVATTITFDRSPVVIKVGSHDQIGTTVTDDMSQPMPGAALNWTSSNPGVVTVDDKGNLTGLRRGDSLLRAAAGTASAEVLVKVR